MSDREPEDPGAAARTRALGGGAPLSVERVRLRVVDGPDAGKEAVSSGARLVVGSSEPADLFLTDPTVSRFHCEVAIEDGRPVVKDLESRNGTRLDGVAIARAFPRPGSVLEIGRTRVVLDLGPDQVEIPISARDRFGRLVGRSAAMRQVFAVLERAAGSDATVLLEGETGTGKELAAESIHAESERRDGPFIVVDCGAIPPDLLESELFGHERGAFTGAVSAREGAFEAASGGTIFLDEIGELPLELQPKLLRVLESRRVKRVGATPYQPVDVRVIAATNRTLHAEVNQRRVRSDLYYRLAVICVRLPPLRERVEDIPALVEHIVAGLPGERGPRPALLDDSFLAHLTGHFWPGNVRELRNYLERCVALRDLHLPVGTEAGSPAGADDAAPDLSKPLKEARDAWNERFERAYLRAVLDREGGNVTAAARAAQVDRAWFYRLLWKHGLR